MQGSGRGVIQEDNLGTVVGDKKAQLAEMLAAYVAESGDNSFYLRFFAGMCRSMFGTDMGRPFDSKKSKFKDEREEVIHQAYEEMKIKWLKAELPKPSDWRYDDDVMKTLQQGYLENSAVIQLKTDLKNFFVWMNKQQQRPVFTPEEIKRIEELLVEGLVFQIGAEHAKGQTSKKIEAESAFMQALSKVFFSNNPAQDNFIRKTQHAKFPPMKSHFENICMGTEISTNFSAEFTDYTKIIALTKDFSLMTKDHQVEALTKIRDGLIAKTKDNPKKDEIVKAINGAFDHVINIYRDGYGRDYESLQRAKEIASNPSATQEEKNYVEHIAKMILRMNSDDKPSLKVLQTEVADLLKSELEKAKTLVTNQSSEEDVKKAESVFKSVLAIDVRNNPAVEKLKSDATQFIIDNKDFAKNSGLLNTPSQNQQLIAAMKQVNESHKFKKSSEAYEESRKGAEYYFRNVLRNGNKLDKLQAVQFLRKHHVFARDNKLGDDVKNAETVLGIKSVSPTREKFNTFKAAAVDAKRTIADIADDVKTRFRRR